MKTIESLTEAEIAELPILPDEWIWARLGEIHILKSDKYKGSGESLFYVGLEHINKDQGTLTEYAKVDLINTVKNSFKKGDLLYGKLRPYLNKVYLANEDGVCSTDILVFESTPSLNLNYSKYFFLSYKFVNDMTHHSSGVNLPRVSTKYLQEYPFPLPPFPEQRAIVSKIEQLFSELDNGIANLKLAQEQLKVYRQAVLKKAFEGELTRKWREQQTDLPDAGELLEQIRKEREEVTKNSGKKMNKINPFTELELAEFSRLPEGWGWDRLEGIGYWTGGGTPSKRNLSYWTNGDVLWVSPKDMKTTLIVDTKDKITKDSIENSSAKWIAKDSILFVVRSGIIRRILPIAIAGRNLTTNQDLQSLTLFWGDKDYVFWYCQANEQIIRDKCAKDGTTVDNIEVPRLKSYPIAICSLTEQQAIVQEIETRLSVCDKIEQDIEANLEKAEALRQSILKKAFEGKLLNERELAEVRRAEDWEPAEVLLERIRAERAENGKKIH